MKKLIFFLTALWSGGTLGLWYWNDHQGRHVEFRTVRVERGDLLTTIDATGTIEPEEVVDVGAQVVGRIESFGQDPRDTKKPIGYGSAVDVGTVLAHLDDALFRARLDQMRAKFDRAQADVQLAHSELFRAERELDRVLKLKARGAGMISDQERDDTQANHKGAVAKVAIAEGALAVAKADLEEAEVNLKYTTIRSPVKGVVLDRRVNIGQTVVASLNAPSLFLLAKDLSRLEIWASVNEADIGSVHVGQPVRFSVGTFPGESFEGKVAQIRLNASMTHNVVTYTVVVGVDNRDGRLLPYLTARVQFEVKRREGVLLVPNAALRWKPEVASVFPEDRPAYEAVRRRDPGARGDDGPATLWVRNGIFVRPIPVKVGPTDGTKTEVEGARLSEGLEVVTGIAPREGQDNASPFLPEFDANKKKDESR